MNGGFPFDRLSCHQRLFSVQPASKTNGPDDLKFFFRKEDAISYATEQTLNRLKNNTNTRSTMNVDELCLLSDEDSVLRVCERVEVEDGEVYSVSGDKSVVSRPERFIPLGISAESGSVWMYEYVPQRDSVLYGRTAQNCKQYMLFIDEEHAIQKANENARTSHPMDDRARRLEPLSLGLYRFGCCCNIDPKPSEDNRMMCLLERIPIANREPTEKELYLMRKFEKQDVHLREMGRDTNGQVTWGMIKM